MAPAAWRERLDTSLDLNPKFGPQKSTAVLRFFDIMVGFFHLPDRVVTWDSGMEGGALWDLGWSTRRRRSALGRKIGSPDAFCPICLS